MTFHSMAMVTILKEGMSLSGFLLDDLPQLFQGKVTSLGIVQRAGKIMAGENCTRSEFVCRVQEILEIEERYTGLRRLMPFTQHDSPAEITLVVSVEEHFCLPVKVTFGNIVRVVIEISYLDVVAWTEPDMLNRPLSWKGIVRFMKRNLIDKVSLELPFCRLPYYFFDSYCGQKFDISPVDFCDIDDRPRSYAAQAYIARELDELDPDRTLYQHPDVLSRTSRWLSNRKADNCYGMLQDASILSGMPQVTAAWELCDAFHQTMMATEPEKYIPAMRALGISEERLNRPAKKQKGR